MAFLETFFLCPPKLPSCGGVSSHSLTDMVPFMDLASDFVSLYSSCCL